MAWVESCEQILYVKKKKICACKEYFCGLLSHPEYLIL